MFILFFRIDSGLDRVWTLLAIGGQITASENLSEYFMNTFEKALLEEQKTEVVQAIIESGFWPSFLYKIYPRSWPNFEEDLSNFNTRFSRFLTLKRLAANVIRTSLRPNAVAGLKHLLLPPGFDQSYVTLGLHCDSNVQLSTLKPKGIYRNIVEV